MGEQSGEGMALTGLILGGIGLALCLLAICAIVIIVILAASGPGIDTIFENIISGLEAQP